MTVLGEAISNSWDADAENVWIYINREKNFLLIKDDGIGMNADDFQGKFLKIGYSKRKNGVKYTDKGRPYIGRKGIGKLALLSCSDKVSIITRKTETAEYVGGVIDNSGLDQAITDDLNPKQYPLNRPNHELFEAYKGHHGKGTIIYFENIKGGIKNRIDYLKKLVALYFRFSLLDANFNIFINDDPITLDHLEKLAEQTQFLWVINDLKDNFITNKIANSSKLYTTKKLSEDKRIKGFIASVEKPSNLKIMTTEEKVSIDLFVNGRLREKNIIKHIPSTRWVESYLYGQIHFDELDGDTDRFTSSREGIVADDPEYKAFLENLRKIIAKIMDDWDKLRWEINQDADPDSRFRTKKETKSKELFNVVAKEYAPPKKSKNKPKIDGWVNDLADDAQFNFSSYAECFISENLIRKFIQEQDVELSSNAKGTIEEWKKREEVAKNAANISIELHKTPNDLNYLSMDGLANLADKVGDKNKDAGLSRDAIEYKPVRNAMAHTALLSDLAKSRLTATYENIKARLKTKLY